MVAGMSAYPFPTGSTLADGWPTTRVMAGLSAVPVGHALDLAGLFPMDGDGRSEAVQVETRRHLGGCLMAVETALRLTLERAPALAAALAQSPDPLCWPTLCLHPTLLSPALLAHMRMRAAVGILLRQTGMANEGAGEEAGSDASDDPGAHADGDAATGDLAAALALAEGRWATRGGESQPMRPDLPAEYFAELVWIAAACLGGAATRSGALDDSAAIDLIGRAGSALLAAHDEAVGPIAIADRLVRAMGAAADDPRLLGTALRRRRFLLFAALAARRTRLDTAGVVGALLSAPMEDVASLCRLLGATDSDYRYLLLALAPVRARLTDAVIVAEAERYQALTVEQAEADVAILRAPAALRVKLDHLRRVMRA